MLRLQRTAAIIIDSPESSQLSIQVETLSRIQSRKTCDFTRPRVTKESVGICMHDPPCRRKISFLLNFNSMRIRDTRGYTRHYVALRRDETRRNEIRGEEDMHMFFLLILRGRKTPRHQDTKMRDVTVKNKAAEGNTTDAA